MTFDLEAIRHTLEGYGPLGPLVSIGLMMLHSLVPLFPAELVVLANGLVYGPLWGFLLSWVGAMLGACLGFAAARYGGRRLAERFVSAERVGQFGAAARRFGVVGWLLVRLTPVISFNLVNYAAGLSPLSWWAFVWTTGLGILPVTLLMVVTADQLSHGQRLGVWLLSALTLSGLVVWWRRRKRA